MFQIWAALFSPRASNPKPVVCGVSGIGKHSNEKPTVGNETKTQIEACWDSWCDVECERPPRKWQNFFVF